MSEFGGSWGGGGEQKIHFFIIGVELGRRLMLFSVCAWKRCHGTAKAINCVCSAGMTKIKMSKEESGSADFVERRRAALERWVFCVSCSWLGVNAMLMVIPSVPWCFAVNAFLSCQDGMFNFICVCVCLNYLTLTIRCWQEYHGSVYTWNECRKMVKRV